MIELRINGYSSCGKILKKLKPFTKFKKQQLNLSLKVISKLKNISKISQKDVLEISKLADRISKENYLSANRKYSHEYFRKLFKN